MQVFGFPCLKRGDNPLLIEAGVDSLKLDDLKRLGPDNGLVTGSTLILWAALLEVATWGVAHMQGKGHLIPYTFAGEGAQARRWR